MIQTISENFINYLRNIYPLYFINIKYIFNVKILKNIDNPQVIKVFYSLIRTLETTRLLNILFKRFNIRKFSHNIKKDKKWNEWLADLIDGCFLLSKQGYASLEITIDIRDKEALQIIKNIYGGFIKLRSNVKAIRYRLHRKSDLLILINDINRYIRNYNRLIQLNKICNKYNINIIYPKKLNYDNGWLSAFFDVDGTITINKTNTQLSISLSQKRSELLQSLLELYGGNIYLDRNSQTLKWYVTKREDILNLVEYFKINPSRSAKNNRIRLIF